MFPNPSHQSTSTVGPSSNVAGVIPPADDIDHSILEEDNEPEVAADSDSDCEDFIHDEVPTALKDQLVLWYLKYKVKLNAFTALLKILTTASVEGLRSLPKDARTVVKTPQSIETKKLTIGEYFHFGIQESVLDISKRQSKLCDQLSNDCEILLTINIDSLPLSKSTKCELIPILCRLQLGTFYSRVFCVGLYLGKTKGIVGEYLDDFVTEYNNLQRFGFMLNGMRVFTKIRAIICDAPARSYIKGVKGHTAGNGCDKCYIVGVKYSKMTFTGRLARERTDEEFRQHSALEYHKESSPFEKTSVDMIKDFVIDYMHCILLGIMRKLLRTWLGMDGANRHKLKNEHIRAISALCIELAKSCPSEFSRKPRSLDELNNYKATEFRMILLYTGMLIFKDFVSDDVFKNFMDLMVAMKILLNPNLAVPLNPLAHRLLLKFNKDFERLYTKFEVVYNVHQLIHLADEALRFGSLDTVCSFPFESQLYQFKLMKRRPNAVLKQLVARISESRRYSDMIEESENRTKLIGKHCNGPLPSSDDLSGTVACQFTTVFSHQFRFSIKNRDSYVLHKELNQVGQLRNIFELDGVKEVYAVVSFFVNQGDHFVDPISSSVIGIHRVSVLSGHTLCFPITDFKKVWLMPRKDYFVAVELSTTINY